jgi:anaerobic magnesium-protoporphyrin IX monomethyl ester cyclase
MIQHLSTERADFPVSLVFPPQGHFTQPYLALPCLKAWLHEAGYQDVELRDLSIEAYDHFLTPEYLSYARERAAGRLGTARFEDGTSALSFDDMRAWRTAVEAEVSAEVLIDTIEDAKAVLRGPDFFQTDRYVPAVRALYHGLRLVSAAHYPSELTPHNFTMRYANDRSREVLAATRDEAENPFIRFYREEVLPGLIERRPRVLGMSVIYGSQLIPALTLGRMVKEALPDCHITAGGGFLAYIGKKLMHAPGIEDCLDSMIFHEGENPLTMLCDALREGREDLSEVGGMTWFDRRGEQVTTVENGLAHPIKLNDAPPPNFDGLPFEKYFSPSVVIPYDINRGCYYGECTFCTLPTVIGPGYRTRKADTIAQHVLELRDRHGAAHFNFITDCMPPGMIKDLPDQLIENRAGITWWSDARVEPKAYSEEGARRLYESGCRKLLFGFETPTPRLLKMMKKGTSLKSTVEVAENCAKAGISVTWYAMVGFPSETLEEARNTIQFIKDNAHAVREVSLQTFHIDEVAQTYREPEKFGIEILDDPDADLQLYHDYESSVGMTQEEAAEAFEEMMTALRETLPLFAGDNIFYFMQKSHYFLHLAAGVKPDEFIARCTERSAARDERDAREDLVTAERLVMRPLPFSYSRVVKTLAHPLARAARPDFLTGRFVADAEETARARLEAAPREERVLAYDAENHDFVELTPDGRRVLQALQRAGSLGGLLAAMDPAQPASARAFEKVTAFARDLHRRGLLLPGERRTLTPHPRAARRAAPATAPTPLEDPTHA